MGPIYFSIKGGLMILTQIKILIQQKIGLLERLSMSLRRWHGSQYSQPESFKETYFERKCYKQGGEIILYTHVMKFFFATIIVPTLQQSCSKYQC